MKKKSVWDNVQLALMLSFNLKEQMRVRTNQRYVCWLEGGPSKQRANQSEHLWRSRINRRQYEDRSRNSL